MVRYLQPHELDSTDDVYIHGHDFRPDQSGPTELFAHAYYRRLDILLKELRRWIRADARVADLGCAQGNIGLRVAETGCRVILGDRWPTMLSYARRKRERGRVDYVVLELALLPFADGCLDCIVSCEVIEHLDSPEMLISESHRVLRPGGILLLTTPNGSALRRNLPIWSEIKQIDHRNLPADRDDHRLLFTPDELADEMQAHGFSILTKRTFNTPVITGFMKLRYLTRRLPTSARNVMEDVISHLLPARAVRAISHELMVVGRKNGTDP